MIYVKPDKIDEILNDRGWSRNRIAQETGLRPAVISELCNNGRMTINRSALYKIMKTLGIKDMNEVLEIRE